MISKKVGVKSKLLSKVPLHFTLIDPEKCKTKKERDQTLKKLKDIQTDAVLVGGSANLNAFSLVELCKELKRTFDVPIISFLRDSSEVNPFTDAAFAPMVINSRKMWFLVDNFLNCVDNIQEARVELITLAYIVQEGNSSVSFAVDPLPIYTKESILRKYARAINALNFDFAYLEGGSGTIQPISLEVIKIFKKSLDAPLLVGGGIGTSQQATEVIKAGASGLIVGTLFEKGTVAQMQNIVSAVKQCKL